MITYCIPTKNNLRYLKHSIQSIRENSELDYDIIVYVDSDEDGTEEWLKSAGLRYILNQDNQTKGTGFGYNACVKNATTEFVCMYHADMYMGKGFDTALIKTWTGRGTVVSGTRVEPPLHPAGKEKVVKNFGNYFEDFKKEEFDNWVRDAIPIYRGVTTEGIFAPWLIHREDYMEIGGHDIRFNSYHEDSDIFNRFILNGWKLIQTWEGFVYHLTCRAGIFKDGAEAKTSDVGYHLMRKTTFRNYIRKWKSPIINDEYHKPVLCDEFNTVKFSVKNLTLEGLYLLEPWADKISCDLPGVIVDKYLEEEGRLSIDSLELKLKYLVNRDVENVELIFDYANVGKNEFSYIENLQIILDQKRPKPGTYTFGIFTLKVNRLKSKEISSLIKNTHFE